MFSPWRNASESNFRPYSTFHSWPAIELWHLLQRCTVKEIMQVTIKLSQHRVHVTFYCISHTDILLRLNPHSFKVTRSNIVMVVSFVELKTNICSDAYAKPLLKPTRDLLDLKIFFEKKYRWKLFWNCWAIFLVKISTMFNYFDLSWFSVKGTSILFHFMPMSPVTVDNYIKYLFTPKILSLTINERCLKTH